MIPIWAVGALHASKVKEQNEKTLPEKKSESLLNSTPPAKNKRRPCMLETKHTTLQQISRTVNMKEVLQKTGC